MSAWSQMSPRDRRALTLGGAVLVPALLFALVVRPLAGGVDETRERVREQRELLARERGLVAQAAEYPSRLRRAEAALRAEGPRLFRGIDGLAAASALEEYVSDAADRNRVSVRQSESRDGEPVGEGITALQVDLQGEGDLRGILSLLRALDAGTRLVRVEQLAIQARGAGEDAPLSFSLTAVGYAMSVEDVDDSPAADGTPSGSAPADEGGARVDDGGEEAP
ncbi:MAG TPA: type II secretion system protein GspM [Longimicrobium sp.]